LKPKPCGVYLKVEFEMENQRLLLGIKQPNESEKRVNKKKPATVISKLLNDLVDKGKTLQNAIEEKELYFRISLIGTCNLNCEFCHNEGAPFKGKLEPGFTLKVIKTAASLGFKRIQFTGGEPLLHPQLCDFIRMAKPFFPEVGLTTNGIFLEKYLHQIIEAGISRIHISLQSESLTCGGTLDHWEVPPWLDPILDYLKKKSIYLRLNIPVPHSQLDQTRMFLQKIAPMKCSIKLFSVLPLSYSRDFSYPLDDLVEIARAENLRRQKNGDSGSILVREYREPSGFRCQTCPGKPICQEQSRSLRLGPDRILRPCLATREWDIKSNRKNITKSLTEATLLALDY